MDNSKFLIYSGMSSVGRIRTNNEDAFYVDYIWDENNILAIVADGLGGCEKGEVASNLAVETIVTYLKAYRNGDRLELLRQAVIAANNAIIEKQKELPDASNMSTVITVSIFDTVAHLVYMAHVGDTRLYQFTHDEGLVKLSHDHTLVGYKEEQGELTEIEAMSHPKRNEISKLLGAAYVDVNSKNFVEINSFDLLSQSYYLLCSDGLYDLITSDEIAEILDDNDNVTEKSKKLIEKANAAGGKDNITVVLIENHNAWDEKTNTFSYTLPQKDVETASYVKRKIIRKRYFVYMSYFIIGVVMGVSMYFFADKYYIKQTNVGDNVQTDTVFIETLHDSIGYQINKRDSIIHKIEEDLKLLKSV